MTPTPPRALIVDDDTITLRFFEGAFNTIGWSCAPCVDAAQALAIVERETFELLVLDRHLPDMRGDALLRALRNNDVTAPAIATSAEIDASVRDQLIDAGFADVIAKPISLDALRGVVTRCVGAMMKNSIVLDDVVALNALGGDRNGLHALRNLLADELTELQFAYTDIENIDVGDFNGRLHRLRASCGFCGATALADATAHLQNLLRETPHDAREKIAAYFELCIATAQALRAEPTTAR